MSKRFGWLDLVLPLFALLPAMLVARVWSNATTADLPYLALTMYAAWRLALTCGLGEAPAFALAACGTALLWVGAAATDPTGVDAALLLGAALLTGGAWAAGRSPWRDPARRGRVALGAIGLGAAAALLGAGLVALPGTPGQPSRSRAVAPAEQRPAFFIPVDLDPTGRRLLLFSLRDLDEADSEQFSLWTLDTAQGSVAKVYRGYPLYLTDWGPAGNQLTYLASEQTWEDEAVPFGVMAARFDGGARWVLRPPTDGSTWMYPLWSKRDDLVGVWRLPASDQAARRGLATDLPRSFVAPVAGGQPKELTIRGCRLTLLGAWQADRAAGFAMTERGLFAVDPDGRAKRLVPTGEAPLDPFPFVIPQGVSPAGKHLAYLNLVFRRGEIDRIDLGLTDLAGHRRLVLGDLYPVAFDWSADGGQLAAARVGRGNAIDLLLLDLAKGSRRWVKTGLKLASREYPMRVQFSRDGRYLAIDGLLADEENWDIAILDLQTGQATPVSAARNHLAIGWRGDGRLVVSTLNRVATVAADGSDYRPIYGASTVSAEPLGGLLACAAAALQQQTLRAVEPVQRALSEIRGVAP